MELGKRLRKCRVVSTDDIEDMIGKSSRKITFSAVRQCLLADNLPDEYRSAIQKNAYDILRVEHNLKDYYDILSDHYKYNPKRVNIGDMERNFFQRVRNTLSNIVDFKIYFPKEKDNLFVYVDEERLEYAILELIFNALHHAEVEPDKQRKISIWISRAGKKMRFSVGDNGMGMEDEEIAHCCEPGFSMAEDKNSLGLGLCLVRFFAEACHGKLEITSEKRKGTTIKLSVPRAEEEKLPGVASATTKEIQYPDPVNVMLGM